MSSFKERLQFLWGDAKPAQIARDLNWSISGVLRIFEKDTIPKAETLVSIQKLKGCDWKWLMTGEGVPFPKGSATGSNQELQEPVAGYNAKWNAKSIQTDPEVRDTLGNPVDLSEFVFIPRYNVKVAAGHGYAVEDEKPRFTMAFRKYWIRFYLRTDPKSLSVVKVTGDSMEERIAEDAAIAVDAGEKTIRDGKIYAFRHGDLFRVKYLSRLPGGRVKIKSHNPAYEDEEAGLEDIEVIGRVFWWSVLD